MTSQSLKYGGIHDGHFENIQTTSIKVNGLLSTLLQE